MSPVWRGAWLRGSIMDELKGNLSDGWQLALVTFTYPSILSVQLPPNSADRCKTHPPAGIKREREKEKQRREKKDKRRTGGHTAERIKNLFFYCCLKSNSFVYETVCKKKMSFGEMARCECKHWSCPMLKVTVINIEGCKINVKEYEWVSFV